MSFSAQWASAKKKFESATGKKKPSAKFLGYFRKGTGVGDSLKAVDAAKSESQLLAAIPKFMVAKAQYQAILKGKLEKEDLQSLKSEIDLLSGTLDTIAKDIEIFQNKRLLPLTPGMTYGRHTVADIALIDESVKPKWLDIKETRIIVEIAIDKTLLALAKKGKEGVRLQEMNDVAQKSMLVYQRFATDAVIRLDQKLLTLSPVEREAKIKEANAVLAKTARDAGERAVKAVEAYWAQHKAAGKIRKMYLIKGTVKIVAGAISVTANAVKLVASLGADVTAYLAIAKSMQVMYKEVSKFAKSIDSASEQLQSTCSGLMTTMDAGKAKHAKQTLAELFEVADFGANFKKTARGGRQQLDTLIAKVQGLDAETDKLVGKCNEGLDKIRSIESKPMSADVEGRVKKMAEANSKILDDIGKIQQGVRTQKDVMKASRQVLEAFESMQNPTSKYVVEKTGMAALVAAGASLVNNCVSLAQGIASVV